MDPDRLSAICGDLVSHWGLNVVPPALTSWSVKPYIHTYFHLSVKTAFPVAFALAKCWRGLFFHKEFFGMGFSLSMHPKPCVLRQFEFLQAVIILRGVVSLSPSPITCLCTEVMHTHELLPLTHACLSPLQSRSGCDLHLAYYGKGEVKQAAATQAQFTRSSVRRVA